MTPEIAAINATPNPQNSTEYVFISCTVTDNM
jgi:hypothetical protein